MRDLASPPPSGDLPRVRTDRGKAVLGIDVGGTHIRVAVADETGKLLGSRREQARSLRGEELAQRVAALAEALCPDGPAALAIGFPGPVVDGKVGHLVNRPELDGDEAVAKLRERLGVPVTVDNDVNLAAFGEHRCGCGQAVADLAFVAVGTGVGMGIVVDGRVLHGARGAAGELGMLPVGTKHVAPDPRALGPLEAIAGGGGLAARWAELAGEGAEGRDAFAAAAAGEATARRLLTEQAAALAMAIRAIDAILDPPLIVLGGGIGSRPDVLARVRATLAGAEELPYPRLVPSTLGERAGVIGAVQAARAICEAPSR
ncbi:MAG: ROK family protein [Actinobacteria bacterium]|nr:ROK family protein [Actinomycetota bacterium]